MTDLVIKTSANSTQAYMIGDKFQSLLLFKLEEQLIVLNNI